MPNRSDITPLEKFLPEVRKKVAAGRYDFENCKTREYSASAVNGKQTYFRRDVVAAALHTECNVGKMALLLGRSRAKLKEWLNKPAHSDVKQFMDDHFQSLLDCAENNIVKEAAAGNLAASKWLLETRGKDRGYTKRVEKSGGSGITDDDLKNVPRKKLENLLERLSEADVAAQDMSGAENVVPIGGGRV